MGNQPLEAVEPCDRLLEGTVEKVGVDEFDQWKFMNWGGTLKRVFELGGAMNKGIEANTLKLEDSLEGATPLQIFKY